MGSITKTNVGSQKTDNRDVGSQGNANRDISIPGNTTTDIGSGKSQDDSSSAGDLFEAKKTTFRQFQCSKPPFFS